MKTCNKCGEEKPLEEFRIYRPSKGYRDNYCISCRQAYHREWRQSNRDNPATPVVEKQYVDCGRILPSSAFGVNRSSNTGLRPECKECNALQKKARLYGLTREEILSLCEPGCNLCGTELEDVQKYHIDHDHSCCSGRGSCGLCVRGATCHSCNVKLISSYEKLPLEMRDWATLNDYLERRPIRDMRIGLVAA